MPALVKSFDETTLSLDSAFGEKAKGLGQLFQLKLAVPFGFCVHKEAYNSFIKANGIYDRLLDFCRNTRENKESRASTLSYLLRGLIRETDLQDNLFDQILAAFKILNNKNTLSDAVAVRSSIVVHENQAFHYEVDTYLNINESKSLIQAIKDCWASLWTDRAITQREQSGISHVEAEIGVIVQEMINAEFSGVLYTSNPVTGNKNEVVIDACWGLGEGASQGRTNADNFIINKQSLSIQENIGKKDIMIIPNQNNDQGTVEIDVPALKSSKSVLQRDQIRQLARLGLIIDEQFSAHQVIEWAWYNDKPYILQINPVINTLIV